MEDLIESILTITDDPRRDYRSDDDVEKKLFELLTKQLHKPDVSGSVCDHSGAKWEHVKFCRKCNKGLQIVAQTDR